MNTLRKVDSLQGCFFDPLLLGELKHYNFLGIPWTNSRFSNLLFVEEKKFIHNAIIKLIKMDYQSYHSC